MTKPTRSADSMQSGPTQHTSESKKGGLRPSERSSSVLLTDNDPGSHSPSPATRKASSVPLERESGVTEDDLLTIEGAAVHLSMSVRYVRRLVADRRVVFYRLGRSVRFKPSDLEMFVDSSRVEPLTSSDVYRDLRSVA